MEHGGKVVGMMFTKEEFNTMVAQLLDKECVSFDMLCSIAEKTLRPTVVYWCASDEALRGQKFEDDIMQEIQIRLIKTCKSSFLLRNGINGPINNDPDGFKSWIFKVALNIKRDFSSMIRKINGISRGFEEGEENSITDNGGDLAKISEANVELLSEAFSVVIDSDSNVYKTLTWIAQFLFMIEFDITKIQSNDLIIKTFEDKNLKEMYQIIIESSKKIPWLTFSEEQKKKIDYQLSKTWGDNQTISDVKYKEFFMKKGGKATISDWINRMNNLVKRGIGNETFNF